MAFSTGLTLLTVESERLIDKLIDFFEFSGGSVVSAKGATSSITSGATPATGVDGITSDALHVSTTGFIDLGLVVNSGQGFTVVAFAVGNWGIYWGDYGNSLTSLGYRAGYQNTGNRIVKKDSGVSATFFTLPSVTLPAASNGFQFWCFNVKDSGFPSQTFKVFDGSGGGLLTSTQNFGVTSSTSRIFTNDWVANGIGQINIDKVSVFKGELTPAQIYFLYNSGNGRSYLDIQNSHL